jgi:hypothetical protein
MGNMIKLYLCAVLAALLGPVGAHAATTCASMRAAQTPAVAAADAALVSTLGRARVTPQEIGPVLADGPWRLVFATPTAAERGVFFFRRDLRGRFRLVEVWGGVIPPEERTETVRWISSRYGAPAFVVGCMVELVIAGA